MGGCQGKPLPGAPRCLHHAEAAEKDTYFATLNPGAVVDHRGTVIDSADLQRLCAVLTDPTSGHAVMHTATFAWARFVGKADFTGVEFSGRSVFQAAVFEGPALFGGTVFSGDAVFSQAEFLDARHGPVFSRSHFEAAADFRRTTHQGEANFDQVQFAKGALFGEAQFAATGRFSRCAFAGAAEFHGAEFKEAVFAGAEFHAARELGVLVCTDNLNLAEAQFHAPVQIRAVAHKVNATKTIWHAQASLVLRYATIDLAYANLAAPFAINHAPNAWGGTNTAEARLIAAHPEVTDLPKPTCLRGVDAGHVVLTDCDVSQCLFDGAFHLDQIQLRGNIRFAQPPAGRRWTRRNTVIEEHYWRRLKYTGWNPPTHPTPIRDQPGPEDVAALYRQLRKSMEDAKDESGAADFYYGEMEMRRHDSRASRSERRLLSLYWLFSGYGLRASRALYCLLAAMTLTLLLLLLVGLPNDAPDPQTTGTLTGNTIQVTTKTPDPVLNLPLHARFTGERSKKAAIVVVNSVVFKSSGQNLTFVGTVIEMLSRISEPVLLGLAALAVRGRLKR
ncbi:hypothetical protein VM95_34230 [Streptomyces rubellomurinus]|uniref:Metal transporter n=1 Tax=Streptomyces rubellomurinus (strain ATCC 31215) TaxID=359131 RepID=A0A0F2T966_STRR3|nr:hypothetical protein VM95_34230 [Streptomyces rubellomurinus]